jgi:3-oxoadipate enol-lactonase
MPLVSRGEAALNVVESGRRHGEAVLLLHALGASVDMWAPQLKALERHFRVLRYDVRGHGRSTWPAGAPAELTIADLAGDALAVLDAAGVGRAHWCGLSLGGMTAMWAAAEAPHRVGRLVLASTTAHFPPPEVWASRIETVLRDGLEPVAAGVAQRWFTEAFRAAHRDVVERTVAQVRATSPRAYAACCAAVRDMDQRERLGAIRAATLVVAGAADPGTTVEHAEATVARIGGADLLVLDAAHLCNVEQADDFNEALLDFLRG